jgi:diketogulonate reductase-like aldo/keto reductase
VGRGLLVIPKSVNPSHIKENFSVVELTQEAVGILDSFARERGGEQRFINPPWGRDLGFAVAFGTKKVSDGGKS